MLSLIAAGASAPVLFDQFISEKEGNALVAVMDPGGVWSLCHWRDKALAWVDRNIKVPLTAPQKVGIASFCPYNIGPGYPSTFYQRINAGDRKGLVRLSAGGLKMVAGIVA